MTDLERIELAIRRAANSYTQKRSDLREMLWFLADQIWDEICKKRWDEIRKKPSGS